MPPLLAEPSSCHWSCADRNGKVPRNLDNNDLLKTEIAYNTPIFTAVTRNHGSGQKSRYTAKITVITAIVNSWFSYSPSDDLYAGLRRSFEGRSDYMTENYRDLAHINKYQLSRMQMDPRDALPHAHRAVHRGGHWVWWTGQTFWPSVDRRKCWQLGYHTERRSVFVVVI